MVKVGDVVRHYNCGVVRRVLTDDNGEVALVQKVGYDIRNLKMYDTDLLQPATTADLENEAINQICKNFEAVLNSVSDKISKQAIIDRLIYRLRYDY